MTAPADAGADAGPGARWAVDVRHLTFDYADSGVRALDDVSFRVREAEVVGIVGRNGSGKTTLAKHLNGLLQPTDGAVVVAGVDTRGRPVQELARHVGYVFQNPNHQVFERSVEADIAFGPRNLGVPEDEVAHRVEQAIAFFGLEAVRRLNPYRIGYPVRKLVGIAGVHAMRPSILVLDEPSTGQDEATIGKVRELIGASREAGTTVVCVSHDLQLLAGVADRLLVMAGGRLIANRPPRDVFADAEVMAQASLEPPPVTAISLRLQHLTGPPPALGVAELAATLEALLAPPAPDAT